MAVWLGVVSSSPGLGFRIPNQDARAIGRGNAFVATADNPSAIYYNPAGITQLEGQTVQFGSHNIMVNSEYTSDTQEFDTEWQIQPVPQLFYTVAFKDKPYSFGLGLFAPFGLGMEWPEDTTFNTLAQEGRLMYMTFNPVIAWKITEQLSIGAGPTFNYSRVELRQRIGLTPGDEFHYKGDDTDFGFSAGIRWQPHQQWAFGASYRSATTINYRGKSTFEPYSAPNGTSAEVDFPQFVIAGISYRPTERWNVEVAVDWTDWDTLDTVIFEDTANGDVPFPLNWRSSFLYHIGVSYQFDSPWYVSAGYFFSENSTTEENFNPIVPDTDLHVGSLGVGYRGKRWSWAVSGQLITGPKREVRGSSSIPSLVGQSADGDYQFFNQAVNFSLALHF